MIRVALRNDWMTARDLERKFMRLFEANFWESNPGPVKTVLNLMGRSSDVLRLPLVTPSQAVRTRLEQLAGELGLLTLTSAPEDNSRMF